MLKKRNAALFSSEDCVLFKSLISDVISDAPFVRYVYQASMYAASIEGFKTLERTINFLSEKVFHI